MRCPRSGPWLLLRLLEDRAFFGSSTSRPCGLSPRLSSWPSPALPGGKPFARGSPLDLRAGMIELTGSPHPVDEGRAFK